MGATLSPYPPPKAKTAFRVRVARRHANANASAPNHDVVLAPGSCGAIGLAPGRRRGIWCTTPREGRRAMAGLIGRQAVVVGAGMVGWTAVRALAGHFGSGP